MMVMTAVSLEGLLWARLSVMCVCVCVSVCLSVCVLLEISWPSCLPPAFHVGRLRPGEGMGQSHSLAEPGRDAWPVDLSWTAEHFPCPMRGGSGGQRGGGMGGCCCCGSPQLRLVCPPRFVHVRDGKTQHTQPSPKGSTFEPVSQGRLREGL